MGLDTVEILMEIEDEFGIFVPDDAASGMLTVGDTYRDIIDRLVAKGTERSAQMEADVWQRLVSIVTKQMGIKPEHVRQESRWIPDITPSG